MKGAPEVVVAIPAYNEERTIAKVIVEAKKHSVLLVVCDDGSSDATAEIAMGLGARVIRHERNMGKGEALRSLFLDARNTPVEVLVTIDADAQHDAKEIPAVAGPVMRGEADVVIGSRLAGAESNAPSYRRFGGKLLDKLTSGRISDTQSGFRAYSRKAIESITPSESGMGVDSEILLEAQRLRLKIAEVPVSVNYELPNTSKRNPVYHFLDVVASVIKLVSIEHPLVFYGIPGLALILTSSVFFLRSFDEIARTGVVTNLAMTYGLIAFGLLLFGLLTAYTGIILFTLTTVLRKERARERP